MKIAKKVLSVLLAIAMVLGTFAVAASANGNKDTATHQVVYSLTAAPITSGGTWTTNTKYAEPKVGDEVSGTMEVEPGQLVMMYLYVKANYYTGYISQDIYYSSGLLDAGAILVESYPILKSNDTMFSAVIA